MKSLSVALPIFNEEATLEQTLKELISTLETQNLEWEIVVVDDGSTDSSCEIVESLRNQDERIRLYQHGRNLGPGGFERSLLKAPGYDWIMMFAGDGQAVPEDIPRFIDLARKKAPPIICGFRQERTDSLYRLVISFFFRSSMLLLFGFSVRDPGWIRMVYRPVVQKIPLKSNSASINAERLIRAKRMGISIDQLPTAHRPRLAGNSSGGKISWILKSLVDLLRLRISLTIRSDVNAK